MKSPSAYIGVDSNQDRGESAGMNPRHSGSPLVCTQFIPVLASVLLLWCTLATDAADGVLQQWHISPPLLGPAASNSDTYFSVKDPTVVSNGGRWHVFATVRGQKRTHQIEYISFNDWNSTTDAERHFLEITNGYFCAPQVFYFTPHRKWYLLYQTVNTNRALALQPAVSTNDRIENWRGWSAPTFLYPNHPQRVKAWIDFWIICDAAKAHLFFTSLNGLMWRAETKLEDFPHGWNEPEIVLRDDIFEASHTYKIKERQEYWTVVEAQRPGGRYYKLYTATRLDGEWKPRAATRERPFAGLFNTRHTGERWTENFSHGEIIRRGADEQMEIDGENLKFVFQGALDKEIAGRKYGEIPWRLGILEQVHALR
jgi:hypothetical protein